MATGSTQFTATEMKEVPCTKCGASIGDHCFDGKGMLVGFHVERLQLREKLPAVAEANLSPTDKALIFAYGFVILCDSVSAHSLQLFNKQLSSLEVQRFFCKKAIDELRHDGLLKQPSKKKKGEKDNESGFVIVQ